MFKKPELVSVLIFVLVLCYPLFNYWGNKRYYNRKSELDLHGIVTRIVLTEKDNPKDYTAFINDTIPFRLEYGMIDVLNTGDSISKNRGQDFYLFIDTGSKKEFRYFLTKPKLKM